MGFDFDGSYLNYVKAHAKGLVDWTAAVNGQPAAILFSYRESPKALDAQNVSGILGHVTLTDPPQTSPEMATVQLDPSGRLVSLWPSPRARKMPEP